MTEMLGWFSALFQGMLDLQRGLHQDLAQAVRALSDQGGTEPAGGFGVAALTLLLFSFGYGVFHAVGPGHGKAVIATHAAASGDALRRSVWMAMLAALVQGTSAVVLVGGAFLVLQNGARWAARSAETMMEPISAAAIAGVGVLILWRGWRSRPWRTATDGAGASGGCGHPHHHPHHHDDGHHDHHHTDHHSHGAACGHVLPPVSPQASALQAVGTAVAVGLRPCSGAILVLVLAFSLKMWVIGVAAAYAMALGTGITVAGLAGLARASRRLADRLVDAGEGSSAGLWAWAVGVLGGTVLVLLGGGLLMDALTRPAHPLL